MSTPEISSEILAAAGKFVDIDTTEWPTVRFTVKPAWFTQKEFDAYLDAFAIILMRSAPDSLRLLFDLSNASIKVDPRFVIWQSQFSKDMRAQYECKIKRTAIVITNNTLRYLIDGYFEQCPATRPKKVFATRAEAEEKLTIGWLPKNVGFTRQQ